MGKEPPKIETLRRLVPVLDIPLIQLVVAARVMTPEEAGLPDYPSPPEPKSFEEIDKLIDRTAMSDKDKAELRTSLARLTGHQFVGTGQNPANGGENQSAQRSGNNRKAA